MNIKRYIYKWLNIEENYLQIIRNQLIKYLFNLIAKNNINNNHIKSKTYLLRYKCRIQMTLLYRDQQTNIQIMKKKFNR